MYNATKTRGGGSVVSVLTFYSYDPSLNPAMWVYISIHCVKTGDGRKLTQSDKFGKFLKQFTNEMVSHV